MTFLGKMCGEGSGCGLRAPGRGGTISFMARVSEKIRITNLDPKSGFVSPQRVERYASFSLCLLLQAAVLFLPPHNSHLMMAKWTGDH